jgi:hypothetical protein
MLSLLSLGLALLICWTVFVLLQKDPREDEIKGVLTEVSSDSIKLLNNIGKLFNLLRSAPNSPTKSSSSSSTNESLNLIPINRSKDEDAA